jgi:hypothetical protein
MKGLERAYHDLARVQRHLEDAYGASTGLDIRDFVRTVPGLDALGQLLVSADEQRDLDLALLLDRDLFSAWSLGTRSAPRAHSVVFEEASHFVYLAFNHQRGRDVTSLEMEMQSEVDRILLAFAPSTTVSSAEKESLLRELLHASYTSSAYETSRQTAASFVRSLGPDPSQWSADAHERLRRFFHSDLGEKLHWSRRSPT